MKAGKAAYNMLANLCRDLVLYIPVWKYADLFLGERYFNWGFQLKRVGTIRGWTRDMTRIWTESRTSWNRRIDYLNPTKFFLDSLPPQSQIGYWVDYKSPGVDFQVTNSLGLTFKSPIRLKPTANLDLTSLALLNIQYGFLQCTKTTIWSLDERGTWFKFGRIDTASGRAWIRPSGETEAMLREMVPPPNPSDFDLRPCPEERPHGFQLNKGEVVLPHMSSWDLICDGTSIGPLGEPPARCEPQRGKPVDDIESLITLRDTYIQRNKVVNEAYADACQLEQSFAAMHQLWDIRGECPPLPPQAATRMSNKLHHIQRVVEEMYRADVPEDPRVLDIDFVQQGKGKGKDLSTLIRAASETSDCDEIPGDDGMQRNRLATASYSLQNSCLTRTLDHSSSWCPSPGDKAALSFTPTAQNRPITPRIFAPDPTSFDFNFYKFPGVAAGATFVLYSVATETYERVEGAVSLVGRREYLIFRKESVHPTDCPRLTRWNQLARDSAEAERGERLPTRAPSSPPIAVAGPSRLSSKRKASAGLQQEMSQKKQKLEEHGATRSDPLKISSDEDSSDVEVV
ncbi:hypothetical protein B0H16DRAFT_1483706 [Mycena metata]|uniref:Uncharacterized protein n=1 Tax=Mycena metata TaxID=1033252 RepID=A0AAD7DX27_9AGAR|nr:hypothetical protein B0H16DRAFT_1483706 [Mycena metata]